jgi:Cu2+-exporting ATPase
MTVQAIEPTQVGQEMQVLGMAAAMAAQSLHPVSRALVQAAQQRGVAGQWAVRDLQELPGLGLQALVQQADGTGPTWLLRLGSARHAGLTSPEGGGLLDGSGSVWLALIDDAGQSHEWARFVLAEDLRAHSSAAVAGLRQAGMGVYLLSGDRADAVARLAASVGITDWRAECAPADKLAAWPWWETGSTLGRCWRRRTPLSPLVGQCRWHRHGRILWCLGMISGRWLGQ